ncbi:MAG: class I SAM-dependent methyltransferase [Armatimonadota bacterium]|jgi:SAM-dependent methyltransferase
MIRCLLRQVPGLAKAYRAAMRLVAPGFHGAHAISGRGAPLRERPRYVSEWLTSPVVLRECVFPRLDGLDWYSFLRQECAPLPRGRCLSLCCGDGSVERDLVRSGICQMCEGVDISSAAIDACRREAAAAGLASLAYRVEDVETIELPAASYDLVIAWMALHHIHDLPRLFGQVQRALRSGGLFVMNEYVGPDRFQLPSAQVALINEWIGRLPGRLRIASDGTTRTGWTRPSAEYVAGIDPSESVSSHQILPAVERTFVTVDRIDYGGGLLQWVLHDIAQNFDPGNAEDMIWLRRLRDAERDLTARGVLASDFCLMIARSPLS